MLTLLISLAHAAPQQLDLADSRALSMVVPSGQVTVTRGDALSVSVSQTGDADGCVVKVDDGPAAMVIVKSRRKAVCAAAVAVTLPEGGRLRLELAEGDVLLGGTDGSIDLLLGEGSVVLEGTGGSVFASIEEGDLRGSALGGLIADVEEGSVAVSWASLPSGDIHVQTREGDVELMLPTGVSLRNEGRDPAAFQTTLPSERTVSAESRRGEVSVTAG